MLNDDEKDKIRSTLLNKLFIKYGFQFDSDIRFQGNKFFFQNLPYFRIEKPTIFIEETATSKILTCKYIFKNKYTTTYFYNKNSIKTEIIQLSDIDKLSNIMDNLFEESCLIYNFTFIDIPVLNFGFLNKFIYGNYIYDKLVKKIPENIRFELLFNFKGHNFAFVILDEKNYIETIKNIIQKFLELKKIINPNIDFNFLLNFENIDELLANTVSYKMIQY